MKKIISILLLAVIALSAKAQTQFRDLSFEEALATAAKEKKQVFIDFYTDWCGPCKNMAKNVFPQVSVGNYMNKNFVCVKYNAEKEGKEIHIQHRCNGQSAQKFPCTFVRRKSAKDSQKMWL